MLLALKEDLELKNKLYTSNVLNDMILTSIRTIYTCNNFKNVSITNLGVDESIPDVAGQFISQMMVTYKQLEE